MDKLKPCPFCGETRSGFLLLSGTAYNPFPYWDSGIRGEECGYVICYNCNAMIKAHTEEEAIEAWNRRTDDA